MAPKLSSRSQYLLNVSFILGLVVLLLNDHYLKAAFGNWYTGKLSDFAGILIFPLFLQFLFRFRQVAWPVLFTVVGFLFWKSPLADPLIAWINTIPGYHISRVVDYTDLWAFTILPITYWALQGGGGLRLKAAATPQWASISLLIISSFAFVATSTEDDIFLADDSDTISCCALSPTLSTLGDGNIFIPSAFTPDGDGVNDVFQVVGNPGIAQIDTFEIRSLDNDSLLFLATDITDISSTTGWDGVVNDTIVPAQYFYRIQLTANDGTTDSYDGLVCCFPCAEPTGVAEPLNLESCIFATQYDTANGTFSSNTPSSEALDCFD